MNTLVGTQPDAHTRQRQTARWLRLNKPVFWIAIWSVYSLGALGYMGYQSAWLGTLCIGVT